MPAAGQGVSIGVRVGSSTYKAVFFIKAKAQISLYCSMAFGYGFQILLQNYFFWESRHFGVVNYADCRLAYLAVIAWKKNFGFEKKTLRPLALPCPRVEANWIVHSRFYYSKSRMFTFHLLASLFQLVDLCELCPVRRSCATAIWDSTANE